MYSCRASGERLGARLAKFACAHASSDVSVTPMIISCRVTLSTLSSERADSSASATSASATTF